MHKTAHVGPFCTSQSYWLVEPEAGGLAGAGIVVLPVLPLSVSRVCAATDLNSGAASRSAWWSSGSGEHWSCSHPAAVP